MMHFNNKITYSAFLLKSLTVLSTGHWVFACGPGDQGSIPGRVILKTQKMVFDAALLNTH